MMYKFVKTSEFAQILNSIPNDVDPEIVVGDEWLPERLIDAHFNGTLLHLRFDNAPQESEEEGRGFVEHELELLRQQLQQIVLKPTDIKTKVDQLLELFLMGHELSSTDVVEKIVS